MSLKAKLARTAAKKTAKHTAHGMTSKLKREPLRSSVLLVVGCAVGILVGRAAASRPAPAQP